MMVRSLLIWGSIFLGLFISACSTGSGSGGGSGGGSGLLGTISYSPKDMEGSWNYNENSQGGAKSCSGSMTFSGSGRLVGFTNSCCSGAQIVDAEFWIFNDGYVKGRNYAWCGENHTDGNPMLKYSMNFNGSDKRTIRGIVDLHNTDADYTRFDITLTRNTPAPPPPNPEPTDTPQVKRSVKATGPMGTPTKR